MTYVAAALIAAALLTAVWMGFAASSRQLTSVENVLFQILMLAAGLSGSFIAGRNSSLQAAREMIRPHARSAFRRALSLHRSLYGLSMRIEALQEEGRDPRLDVVRAVVDEQIVAGLDAMEDWRDIIEDDVDEILERYGEKHEANPTRSRQGRAGSE